MASESFINIYLDKTLASNLSALISPLSAFLTYTISILSWFVSEFWIIDYKARKLFPAKDPVFSYDEC